MKRYFIRSIAFLFMFTSVIFCDSMRNIFTYTTCDLAEAGNSNIIQNTFLMPLSSKFMGVFKIFNENQGPRYNNILTVGTILLVDKFHYVETTYGYGTATNNVRADYIIIDANREKPEYYLNASLKHVSYVNYSYFLITTGVKLFYLNKYSFWA